MSEQPLPLFDVDDSSRPLADRMRPRALAGVVGQDHLLAVDANVDHGFEAGSLPQRAGWLRISSPVPPAVQLLPHPTVGLDYILS